MQTFLRPSTNPMTVQKILLFKIIPTMTSFRSENQGQRCPLANLIPAVKMSLIWCSSGNCSSAGTWAASWSCPIPWALLPVGSLCVSGYSSGNKATGPSESLKCKILWLRVCPELMFTWEREQNLFRSFSVRTMQIKSFLSSKGTVVFTGNSERFIWNLDLGSTAWRLSWQNWKQLGIWKHDWLQSLTV